MRTQTDVGSMRASAARRGLALRVVACPAAELVDFLIPVEAALVLGRGGPPKEGARDPTIALADPRLSGRHVAIVPAAQGKDQLQFVDLESKNGTWKNAQRQGSGALVEGDVLRAGQTIFVTTRVPLSLFAESPADDLVGQSQAILQAWDLARTGGERGVTVLALGETGTGKEGVARLVHRASKRAGPFVALNCATLTGETATATLFGHEKGAFTGAVERRRGAFAEAEGGTLFLDEIGDLPAEIQPRLLRALEEREVVPIGSARARKVDVQLVAATHADLAARVSAGTFRGDLFARLSTWVVELPPLRQRREDILRLARVFSRADAGTPLFEPEAAEALLLHRFPFNVRELRQIMTRLALTSSRPYLLDDVSALIASHAPGPTPADDLDETQPGLATRARRGQRPTHDELCALLAEHQDNVAAVARALGRDRKQIYRWIEHYAIELRTPDA